MSRVRYFIGTVVGIVGAVWLFGLSIYEGWDSSDDHWLYGLILAGGGLYCAAKACDENPHKLRHGKVIDKRHHEPPDMSAYHCLNTLPVVALAWPGRERWYLLLQADQGRQGWLEVTQQTYENHEIGTIADLRNPASH